MSFITCLKNRDGVILDLLIKYAINKGFQMIFVKWDILLEKKMVTKTKRHER